jgi:hypothetical protein
LGGNLLSIQMICGAARSGASELGFGGSNLEQHARRDQFGRVTKATVAEATAGHGTTAIVLTEAYLGPKFLGYFGHFDRSLFGSLAGSKFVYS